VSEPAGFDISGYQVRDRLHQGRDISVYRAVRTTDGLPLIAKVPNASRPTAVVNERLHSEYRILERLRQAGCERVPEPYELAKLGSAVALICEFIPGITLAQRLGGGPLTVEQFLDVAQRLVAAVVDVHGVDVIHKDINPANVVLADSGDVRLVDFDLATLVPREAVEVRSVGALEGTLAYCSPEQTGRTNHSVDYRTDFYSLGATFYEMLTGVAPFVGADRLSVVHQHIARQAEPPSERRQDVPAVLDAIVLKLLAKAPQDRYQSAVGLLADLRRCAACLSANGIEPFVIATDDVSSRFQVPERLYGRESEVATLVDAFRRTTAEGAPRLLLVSGDPGIGKSSLVNEVHAPIVETAGYFVAGKFDQFKRNVPFASLTEALRDLVRQVLTEPDDQLRRHRTAIADAVGANGRLLIDAIPELVQLTGPLDDVPELAPIESQNRYRQVFRSFVEVFARPEHPLCVLLDDIQWIDSATLDWVESTLADVGIGPLLLICAYRSNEVGDAHPFAITLDRLQAKGVEIERVELAPLPPPVVRRFVADALVRPEEDFEDLAMLLSSKTGGNPFFLNQLLAALYHDGIIHYEASSGGWTCDIEQVAAAASTDNVVDYMTERLQLLPARAKNMLQLAACVGNSFDSDELVVAAQMTADEVRIGLAEPVEQGLVVRAAARPGESDVRYRFLHDRVQQAAYQMMDDQQARLVRLRIGRRMLAESVDASTADRLFDALQHVNFARSLVDDPEERTQLARLNLIGAARARASTAYGPALEFATVGQELLASSESSGLSFELALERAECEHLTGHDDAAEAMYAEALRAARDDAERSRVYERKIHFYTNQARFDQAYATGLEAARMLGIWMPAKFIPPLLIADHLKILRRIGKRQPMDLVDLPEMEDERLRSAMKFMGAVAKAAYQIRPELCVSICARIVDISLRKGYTPETAIGYLAYGVIFRGGVRGDHAAGYEFSRLVLALIDRFDNHQQRAEVTFVSGYFANSWIQGLADSEELFRRAYRAGVETGDFFHASCACSGIVQNMLMRGADLDDVWNESERFGEFLNRVQTAENVGTMLAIQQTIRNLRGETASERSYSDASFDEPAFVETLASYGSPHLAHYYFVDKMLSQVLWDRLDDAGEMLERSKRYLKESPGMQHAAEHHFLAGLIHARLADTASGPARRRHVRAVRRAERLHRTWAKDAPAAFAHKQRLLEAELHRLRADDGTASARYDEAIELAERNGYQQTQSIAHERAGGFHLARRAPRTARFHLTEAAKGFHGWGATAVAADLARRYPAQLGGVVFDLPVERTRSSHEHGGPSLDMETVLKASQAISGEVQLDELMHKLLVILRENAGAERGVLFLVDDGVLAPRAQVVEDGTVMLLAGSSDSSASTLGWASSMVNFVARSGESLVLDDASAEVRFRDDPHIVATQPRSVLCAPVVYLGELSGVVYLENNLAPGAFTEERIEVLTLLSGQIGISIANAELYENLEDKVRLRTEQLEIRNRFIRQTFGRYLSDDIVDGLLDRSDGNVLTGEKREVSLIVSDLRGFTPIAEDLRPEDVVALLNIYLGAMTEVLTAHEATIIDFIGDSIIAVFGAPFTHLDDAARAVACAIDMQCAMERVNQINADVGYPPIGMGIAIDTGEVVVGSVGSEKRAKYTVLGSHVNLAARLETYSIQGDVLISDSTRRAVGSILDITREVTVQPKGFNESVTISYVEAIHGRFALRLPTRRSAMIELPEPLALGYVDVDGKHVGDEVVAAWVLRMSEDEADIRSNSIPDPLTNLRLTLPGDEVEPLYAYGKVSTMGRLSDPDGHFHIDFTSLPDRTRATIRQMLAGVGAKEEP
jgi:predicted ATPase/class 3 adenylate cyclase/tRNA A-37 threonylcarbamoyl transferase component Bud32